MNVGRGLALAATGALALAALAVAGQALSPAPTGDRAPENDPSYRALPAQPAAEAAPLPSAGAIRREEISVGSGDERLAGTVVVPTAPGRHPAIVLVHGGGTGSRSGLLDQAERLARAGIVALVYDKRRSGYSFRHRDYGRLADDALAAVAVLGRRADVDPARTGLWGVSEGGWVVPIAAARSSAVAFVVLVSATNVSPLQQTMWIVDTGLARMRAPAGARRAVVQAVGAGDLNYLRYDTRPALRGLHQPVLAIYGAADPIVPLVQSSRLLTSALEDGGNRSYTIRFFAGAGHDLRAGGRYAPGYFETMVRWITGLPGTATPPPGLRIAGARPVQRWAVPRTPAVPGYAGLPVLLAASGLAAAGYLVPAAVRAIGRGRGRGAAPRPDEEIWTAVRPCFRRLGWSTLTMVVSFNAFLGTVVALAVGGGGSVLLVNGMWLVARSASLLTALLAAGAAVVAGSAVRDGWRPSRGRWAAMAGMAAGSGLLLTVSAYYGHFAPQW